MLEKSMSEKLGKPLPQCKAILLCERALRDAATNQASLIGIVRRIHLPQLPANTPLMTAYLQIAEGIGRYEISSEIRNLVTDQTLARGQGFGVDFKDRFNVIELTVPLPPLPVREEGQFELIVLANGQEIGRQKFAVVVASPNHRD